MADFDFTPTIEIPLTKGYTAVIDCQDVDVLGNLAWHVSGIAPILYARAWGRKEQARTHYSLHRLILERILARALKQGEVVDHIDGNPLNNCRANLRLASVTENNRNVRRAFDNTSGYKGVWKNKGRNKWRATITADGNLIQLGSFDTPEDAYRAYCEASARYHGEFGRVS